MNTLQIVLLSSLLLFAPLLPCVLAAPPAIQRQMEIIKATIEGGSIATVDPAACYDTASGELLMNCYDTLVWFDGEHVDRYLPQLATEWVIVQNNGTKTSVNTGLEFFYTYYFKIRTGVAWQDSAYGTVIPEDVEYTFERGMVLEAGDNPQWMFYEPLLNGAKMTYIDGRDVDPEGNLTERGWVGWAIDEAVESNSTHVWFNLAFPGAYAPFLQILTQQWSSILCKQWCLDLGRASNWNGTWGVDQTAYYAYHFPTVPPLDDPEPAVMGSGPFKLAHLDQSLHYWDADRFTEYWRGWPLDWPAFRGSKPAGYIDHLVVTWAYDWLTRSAMFLRGELDFCAVPRYYKDWVVGQPGIRGIYPLPSLSVDALLYSFNINATSPYSLVLPPGTFNESGVPSDFFGNPTYGAYIRKAFSHCIDFDLYIQTMFLGEAVQPATVILASLPYYNASIPRYTFDLTKAVEYFQMWPALWETGFTLNLLYPMSSVMGRQYLPEMIGNNVNSLNPKFHCSAVGLNWASYFAASNSRQLPTIFLGWLADYPDPHNYAYAYYYSPEYFAKRQGYNNPVMDALIEQGIKTADGPARAVIYSQIQQLAIDDCPNIAVDTVVGRHCEQTWVCGWYYNPAYPDNYAANLWKWYYTPHAQLDTVTSATTNLLPYDVNYDGKTNMFDIGAAAASFGAIYGPPISSKWNFRCDFNNDRKIDMKDIGGVAKNFGKTSSVWTPSWHA